MLSCNWFKVAGMHGRNTACFVSTKTQFAQASADVNGGRKSLHREIKYT